MKTFLFFLSMIFFSFPCARMARLCKADFPALGPPDLQNTKFDADLRVSIRHMIFSSVDMQLCRQRDELHWGKRNGVNC